MTKHNKSYPKPIETLPKSATRADIDGDFSLHTSPDLRGWPGYRNRPGRSGLDYVDTAAELAHIEGVLLRKIFTGQLRVRGLGMHLLLGFCGLIASSPLIFTILILLFEAPIRSVDGIVFTFCFSMLGMPGLILLLNVVFSLSDSIRRKGGSQEEEID